MSILTIGRIGADVDVDGVTSQEFSNNRMSLSVEIYSGAADALALRQQILGYVDSADEYEVPVTWSAEPEIDGYYRVLDVRVSTKGTGTTTISVLDIELERVLGYAAPLLELTTLGARRASSHLTGSQGVHLFAVPQAAKSVAVYNPTTGTYSGTVGGFTRTGATGDIRRIGSSTEQHMLVQFYLAPDQHYAGAATLYVGEGMTVAVGRQIPNTPQAWRISNGLLELEAVASTTFDLRLRMWISGAWSPWVDFQMATLLGGVIPVPHSITVLRNGPEEVAVRLLTSSSTSNAVPVTVDFSLKRGARHFATELRSTVADSYAVKCPSFAGATAVVTDEDRRWKLIGAVHMVMMAPYTLNQASDFVHSNEGGISTVSAWSFGMGMVDAASGTDDHQKTAAEYFFPSSAKQSVVAQ